MATVIKLSALALPIRCATTKNARIPPHDSFMRDADRPDFKKPQKAING